MQRPQDGPDTCGGQQGGHWAALESEGAEQQDLEAEAWGDHVLLAFVGFVRTLAFTLSEKASHQIPRRGLPHQTYYFFCLFFVGFSFQKIVFLFFFDLNFYFILEYSLFTMLC